MKKLLSLALFPTLLLFAAACDDGGEAADPEAVAEAGAEGGAEAGAEAGAEGEAAAPAGNGNGISILTASKSGNYYKAAGELAEVLGDAHKLDIKESPGSYHNIEQLGTGKANLAIAQFDTIMVYMAMDKPQQEMANNSLVLAPLGTEVVHIVTNKKAKIKALKDLKGKKIAVGPQHSGSWISAFNVMFYINKVNIEEDDKVAKLPYDEMMTKLIAGELDAIFVTSAPGMPLLKDIEPKAAKKLALLGLGKKFKLPKDLGWSYSVQEIPGGTYPYQKKKVTALATRSFLLADRNFDTDTVAAIAKIVYEKADELKGKSELWKLVSTEKAKQDIKDQFPYHDGVTKYLGAN